MRFVLCKRSALRLGRAEFVVAVADVGCRCCRERTCGLRLHLVDRWTVVERLVAVQLQRLSVALEQRVLSVLLLGVALVARLARYKYVREGCVALEQLVQSLLRCVG